MIYAKNGRRPTLRQEESDRITSLVNLLEYLISELKETAPETEYFLRMARMSLLEAEQKIAARGSKH